MNTCFYQLIEYQTLKKAEKDDDSVDRRAGNPDHTVPSHEGFLLPWVTRPRSWVWRGWVGRGQWADRIAALLGFTTLQGFCFCFYLQ